MFSRTDFSILSCWVLNDRLFIKPRIGDHTPTRKYNSPSSENIPPGSETHYSFPPTYEKRCIDYSRATDWTLKIRKGQGYILLIYTKIFWSLINEKHA